MKYLIEIESYYENKVQTENHCPDTMLNHQLSQEFKLIRNSEFIYLIKILTSSNICYIIYNLKSELNTI